MITIIIQLILNLITLNPDAPKSDKVTPVSKEATNPDDLATSTFGGTSTWTDGG